MLTAPIGAAVRSASPEVAGVLAMSGGVTIDFDLLTVALQAVLFAALIVVLKPLLLDPVLRILEERERRIEGARDEARSLQERAGELLQRYEQALDRVRLVASEERDRIRTETAKLEDEILELAHQASKQTLEEGRERIAAEIAALRLELGRQSERMAWQMAERVLGRELH